MTVFGLSKKKSDNKPQDPSSQDDAKQVLEQMEKKKQAHADQCMFC